MLLLVPPRPHPPTRGLGAPSRVGTVTQRQNIEPAGGAGLLALEPGAEAGRVEDVVAGQLLAARGHLLAADDADVVRRLELFRRRIRVTEGGREGNSERGLNGK